MTDYPKREEVTKKNYEDANAWHIEKSLSHSWLPQIGRFCSRLAPGARILEVGAGGSGRDTAEFIKRGFTVEALDYSSAAVASLQEEFPEVKTYEMDMRKMRLPNEAYDGIWACAAIVNLAKDDVPVAISEFYRLLRKGGIVFISTKEGEGEKMVPDEAGERFFSFFTEKELKDFVTNAGFGAWHSETTTGLAGTRWICIYAVK